MKMECVLGVRKMLKDVGKGDGLICERGRHTVTFLEALSKWIRPAQGLFGPS